MKYQHSIKYYYHHYIKYCYVLLPDQLMLRKPTAQMIGSTYMEEHFGAKISFILRAT